MIYAVCLGIFALAFLLLWLMRKDTKRLGKVESENEELQKVLEDTHQADLIRDNLITDAEYAKRVRERFTRKP